MIHWPRHSHREIHLRISSLSRLIDQIIMLKLKNKIYAFARQVLGAANIAVTKQDTFDRLIVNEAKLKRYEDFLPFLVQIKDNYLKQALRLLPESKSEIFQDIFVALVLNAKRNGFFVEFGATDGVAGSNTWLFEKSFEWNGLLAEPGRVWHERLAQNRNCTILHDCVWSESGHALEFRETSDAGLSTLSDYAERDRHSFRRAEGRKTYKVKTVALDELLRRESAPRTIDYLSIDTEGSEYDILRAFPMGNWDISIITVEHNFRADRDAIHDILQKNGFVRVLTDLSKFDDWYVTSKLVLRVETVFHEIGERGSA